LQTALGGVVTVNEHQPQRLLESAHSDKVILLLFQGYSRTFEEAQQNTFSTESFHNLLI